MTFNEMPPGIWQLWGIVFFLFGSLLGSFTNVVILRMGEGRSVIFPPSACPRCSHPLAAHDLVPVFSWLFLRGKCRYCQATISWQYPLVEAACAATVGIAFLTHELTLNFILQAGWGMVWLAATVAWIRGEVRGPGPFLWPLAFYSGFRYILTVFPWQSLVACIVVGSAAAWALSRAGKIPAVWSWAGAFLMGILPMMDRFGWWWIVGLAVILVQFSLPPVKPEEIKGRLPVFALNCAGLVWGIIRGNWGL